MPTSQGCIERCWHQRLHKFLGTVMQFCDFSLAVPQRVEFVNERGLLVDRRHWHLDLLQEAGGYALLTRRSREVSGGLCLKTSAPDEPVQPICCNRWSRCLAGAVGSGCGRSGSAGAGIW